MKRIFCLTALVLLLFVACDDGSKKQIETLRKETMSIHDEAMKDLADMNRVSRQLKDMMKSDSITPEQLGLLTTALLTINKADDEMTNWMSNYEDPKGMPPADAIQYLQDQKQKMGKNRDDIRAALEAGKKLLPQDGK